MRRAVVVGSGGAGREIAAWYRAANPKALIVGFLDEDSKSHGQERGDLPVLGGLSWLDLNEVDDVAIGVGAPASRRRVMGALAEREVTPTTVIHPTATIGERVLLGDGTVVSPGVVLTVDIQVGCCAYLNFGASVGHDTVIGDYAGLAPRATIAGDVTIGPGADVGIGASCIQGVKIGEGAIIGGGACVTRDVPERHIAVGVPAVLVREHDRW